jgi:hypothetical protein
MPHIQNDSAYVDCFLLGCDGDYRAGGTCGSGLPLACRSRKTNLAKKCGGLKEMLPYMLGRDLTGESQYQSFHLTVKMIAADLLNSPLYSNSTTCAVCVPCTSVTEALI